MNNMLFYCFDIFYLCFIKTFNNIIYLKNLLKKKILKIYSRCIIYEKKILLLH